MLVSILEVLSQKLRVLLNRAHIVTSRVKNHNILWHLVCLSLLVPKRRWEVLIESLEIFSSLSVTSFVIIVSFASKTWFHFFSQKYYIIYPNNN